ncbi:cysteine synthase A [Permianibacter sp. IMCC34836]|uniref:cysteine synthase A n=1 Tax=Permianibacter fluminis TaxID=2738515 RepID=UPI0015549A2F|nr:cysteine synthase A [Permianibacter fluminis]NQD36060.1 cysteine synthase A [Permianibacter fluminis]
MATFNDNSLSIGNTPLVRLARLTNAKVYAKLESRNPAFSVKCRIGAAMIWDAEKKGLLTAGKEIIEATSGNTGIALAFVAAARGYGLTLTMPASMSLERRKLLKALGAKLVLTDPAKGMRGAVDKVTELVNENPGKYFEVKQFENPANPQIHYDTTGPEIWKDTNGEIDVFVAGVGTGGTLTGVSRYIKLKEGKKITTVAVEPAVSPLISQTRAGEALKPAPHKIQGIGANFVPKNLDLEMVDQVETVSNEEAIEAARQLMLKEGILAGISCGAALVAALRVAEQPQHKGKTIVVVLPDSGERYLSTALFEGIFTEQELVQ